MRLHTLASGGTGSTAKVSPFEPHKRSKSNAMTTLQKQLQDLARDSNSYSLKTAFLKAFRERLNLLEGLQKRCETILQGQAK